jgi:hypothetical protein
MELMQASKQWASRPDDERFTSLIDMRRHFETLRDNSHQSVVRTSRLRCVPTIDNTGMLVDVRDEAYEPTNWAFGQLASLAKAPAGYLSKLPAPLAADCVNYGLQFSRDVEEVGILTRNGGENIVRAATGPNYGRIWNSDILDTLVQRFGDGVSGDWKVPGEFGKAVAVTKANTTLYASDRDLFVFLADEHNRIEIPNRRNGQMGSVARGMFMWNSEVGSKTFGMATFLFDYVCANRIVWGAVEYKQVSIRHTGGAPDRYLDEMQPALIAYANGSASSVVNAIEQARDKRLDKDHLDAFLRERFGASKVEPLKALHIAEEDRPIENLWDVTTAATAYARSIPHQDTRVEFERVAGKVLELAAN